MTERDIYYSKSKSNGYRARSSYKLIQIDKEFRLFDETVKSVVDLCSTPGSWSQVISRRLKALHGKDYRLVSVDMQPMVPVEEDDEYRDNSVFIRGDITAEDTIESIIASLDGSRCDLVVSDGAPDMTGVHEIDIFEQSFLVISSFFTAVRILKDGGNFVSKVFEGKFLGEMITEKLERYFEELHIFKPRSSRLNSTETFLVGVGLDLETARRDTADEGIRDYLLHGSLSFL